MSTPSNSDLLRRIQKLLAQAEGTPYEAERDTFFKAADNLMMKHRIELWEVQQHQTGRISEREPIIRDFDYQFAFDSGGFAEIADPLWSMFLATARFCGCLVVFHKQHYSGETRTYKSYTVPVIGTESDLGWFTLLFTSLMTQLVEQIRPKYDPDKGYEENLRTFKEAGWNWLEIAALMQQHGWHTDVTTDKARHLTAHAYRRWCKRTGVEQNYSNWNTYRRNFGAGFANSISSRLTDMQADTIKKDSTGGMEIALRDQGQINRDFMIAEFPVEASSGRKYALVRDNRKFDSSAYTGGRSAGAKANISGSPGRGVKPQQGKKQLGG
jgi:hypothetical protein